MKLSKIGIGVRNEPLAVVGIGCRFPGDANDPTAFWDLLASGTDAISRTPADRWNLQKFYRPDISLPGKTQSQWGGYVSGIDQFDPALFGISPREAAAMDPQQRMLLEVAYRAMEDSGTPTHDLAGRPVAVFTGISSIDYAVASLSFEDRGELGPYTNTGSSSSIAANRISYCFDLRGPSVAVDTACSSSLVALHMACQAIWNGEAEVALAGGVNALLMPDYYVAFSQLGVLSPDGRCKTFDARANGYARSEGAGAVLIKPLSEAQRSGDRIYCVIRATALNQDGRTPGLTVPSGEQQERLVRRTCELAGVDPGEVQYFEAHGTGTSVGDPIEAGALARVIASGTTHRDNPCRVGSVKTNIGHLEAGAGIASLIKVALAMHHEAIPPHLHLQDVNPEIDLGGWNLHVPTDLEPWKAEGSTRIAGINGFGYGGANGHLIVEEAPRKSSSRTCQGNCSSDALRNGEGHSASVANETDSQSDSIRRTRQFVFPISATDRKSLSEVASAWQHWASADAESQCDEKLVAGSAMAMHHRTHHDLRTLVFGTDAASLQDEWRQLAANLNDGGEPHPKHRLPAETRDKGVVFLCCGQGPQWWAMGRGLYRDYAVFAECIQRIDREFQQHAPTWSLIEELHRDAESTRMNRTSIAQPALFAIQVAQAAMWQSVGVKPSLIIGHSVGEIAAAHLSGGLSFEDACCVAIHRGRTMDLATSRGSMIAVGLTEAEAKQRIANLAEVDAEMPSTVAIAAVNGPASITLSGDSDAVERLAVAIEADGIFCRRLAVEYAFHSPQMEPVREELLRSLQHVQTQPLHTPMVSTVTGRRIEQGESLGGDYWWTNVRQGVRFADAIMHASEEGFGIGIELGPHPVLAFATTECYGHTDQDIQLIATARRAKEEPATESELFDSDESQWLAGLRDLYAFGLDLDWEGLVSKNAPRTDVPLYPMQRQTLWAESEQSKRSRLMTTVHPLLGDMDPSADPVFRSRVDADNQAYLHDHRVRSAAMFPAAAGIEMALSANWTEAVRASETSGDPVPTQLRLQRLQLLNPMILDEATAYRLETSMASDRREIEIRFSETDSDHWTPLVASTHATPAPIDDAKKQTALSDGRLRCDQVFDSEACYQYCQSIGLNYGPAFQGIREGVRRDGESIAVVQLPSNVQTPAFKAEAALHLIHPAVLDSCFHAMVVCDPQFGRSPGGLYLPHEIENVQIDLDALSTIDSALIGCNVPLTVHAKIRLKTDHRLLADLDLYLQDGTHFASIIGFESRRVGAESEQTTRDLLYRYRWEDTTDESDSIATDDLNERRVVFAPADLADELVRGWEMKREDFVWVHPIQDPAQQGEQFVGERSLEQTCYWVDADDPASFDRLWAELGLEASQEPWHLIYLWAIDAPDPLTLETLSPAEANAAIRESTLLTTRAPLHMVQSWEKLTERPKTRMTMVTLGAQSANESTEPVSAIQMPLIGIGRVIVSEIGSLQTRLVDCDPDASWPLQGLAAEWRRNDAEDEVMLRASRRYVHRFVPDTQREMVWGEMTRGDAPPKQSTYRLVKGNASGVDELRHQAFGRSEPSENQVEIEVAGAGLNFSDVMKVLDLYPGLPPGPVALGAEVSGVVTAVGCNVHEFAVGDSVIAVAPGGFASHVLVHEALVAKSPSNVDLVDASAIPVAWLTADHAMNTCARLREGESILVHAASGGVGLAAIEVAQELKVEVFATAGSDLKRDHVRSMGVKHVHDSRSLNFVSEIQQLTSERGDSGIDAILNSLPGEAIPAGLGLLRIGGRFLEIGKRDIYSDQSLGMYPLRNNLALFAIDLDQLFQHHPVSMGERLREIVRKFEEGVYRGHSPKRFEASDASSAFRFMQQAKHIGKVVVDYSQPPRRVRAREDATYEFRQDGTYWLAGGLGGFGLRIADWMSESGAGTLVLSGRSQTIRDAALPVIERMKERGTNIIVRPCDIAEPDDVQRTLDFIDEELPPLRGVLHTAMVLEDKMMVDLDRETLDRVLWPKVLGGWNLHQATRDRVLDQFVLFSSLSSVFGHAGQANYSAANALLDGLAHHRRACGLPATVINWGHLGEVGYLAEREELSERLRRQGVLDFSASEATECLARTLHRGATQCSVLRMDWSRWRGLGLTKDVSPRFAHLIRGGGEAEQAVNGDSLRELPSAEREQCLFEVVSVKLASLLGGNVAELDADRPMLEMGLDSLMAVELRNWIEGQLRMKLQIGALMRGSNLRSLVATLNETLAAEVGESGASSGGGLSIAEEIVDDPSMQDRSRYPMSDQQTGLWYAFRRNRNGTAFNVFLPTRLRSPLDVDALQRCIESVVQRHPALRTTFTDAAGDLQQIVHETLKPEFKVEDWSGRIESGNEEPLLHAVIAETQRPFDLQNGPMMRIRVFRLADDDWVVVATTHHIVVDFWSLILILGEIRQVYPQMLAGNELQFLPPERDYFDLVARQRQLLVSKRGEDLKGYWTKTLADVPKVLEVPTDRIRPSNFTQAANVMGIACAESVGAAINRVAKQAQVTSSSVVMAALQVMLHRATGQEKFVIGSPFAGRTHSDLEDTVGFFVNMLPLVADVSGNPSFLELVQRAGDRLVDSMQHEEYPFAQIVRDVDPPRDTGRSPLIQVSCTFEKAHVREEEGRAGYLFPSASQVKDIGGLRQEAFPVPHQTCHYDLEFIFEMTGDHLDGMIVYCRDLYEADTMQAMSEQFVALLQQLVSSPEQTIDSVVWNMASEESVADDHSSNGSAADRLSTLNELIDRGAKRRKEGDGVDVVQEEVEERIAAADPRRPFNRLFRSPKLKPASPSLSKSRQSFVAGTPAARDQIATALRENQVVQGEFVPVLAQPGQRAMDLVLALQKIGAVPVPLDATRPSVLLEQVLSQTAATRVLVDGLGANNIPSVAKVLSWDDLTETDVTSGTVSRRNGAQGNGEMNPGVSPGDPAYVIYTSGTTGTPKGVVVSHGAIANTLAWRGRITPLTNSDRVLMPLSHQFDAGLGMTLFAYSQGAEVVWPEAGTVADIDAMIDLIIRDKITVLVGVPSWIDLVASHRKFASCHSLRHIWIGGEAMPEGLPRLIRRSSEAQIWNCYGPTEAAVEATAFRVDDVNSRRRIPVGKPADHTDVLVLDEDLKPMPATFVGELALVGAGLADGYLGDKELTAKKFVTLVDGRRAYLTGDQGRRRVDGLVEVLGRIDRQTKIGGYRIEPTEIETVLREHPVVKQAAVVPHAMVETANQRLVGFVQIDPSRGDVQTVWPDVLLSLQHHLAAHLPPYKRPAHLQLVEAFAMTASGKVDLNRLPAIVQEEANLRTHQPPRTALEQYLADRWTEVLGIHSIGVNQSFFEFGGSSLQAAMLTNRLSEDLGVDVPSSLLFDLADISAMAERLATLYPNEMQRRFDEASVRMYESESVGKHQGASALLAPLKVTGDRTPLFMVHPPGGIVVCYRELAASLPDDQPLYAIRSRGLHGKELLPQTMQHMAAEYVEAVRSVQPTGPYMIGGWSVGGVIAMELAQQLIADGEQVANLVLLDSSIPSGASDLVSPEDQSNVGLEYGIDMDLEELLQLPSEEQLPFLWQHAEKLGVLDNNTPADVAARAIDDLKTLFHHHLTLTTQYKMQPIESRVLLYRPTDVPFETEGSVDRGWSRLSEQTEVIMTPGHHHSMVQAPHVKQLAQSIYEQLSQSLVTSRSGSGMDQTGG
ncbi:non-ribosomal peptide synthetase/type I polyketide synthase [Rhodopirellula halodulae]|uniref:non-ribosomal peptide synthetase/type I polyketide synthase n=1 Tax=Rhodopirellula halodulae TaxID=2894198 RepID=UPI001E5F2B50|nr:non-ribosomal peptide synthetase/type I polyketide synthase [Rhodopirellula sp. JC737]